MQIQTSYAFIAPSINCMINGVEYKDWSGEKGLKEIGEWSDIFSMSIMNAQACEKQVRCLVNEWYRSCVGICYTQETARTWFCRSSQ